MLRTRGVECLVETAGNAQRKRHEGQSERILLHPIRRKSFIPGAAHGVTRVCKMKSMGGGKAKAGIGGKRTIPGGGFEGSHASASSSSLNYPWQGYSVLPVHGRTC